MLSVEEIQDALDRPIGKRALNPILRAALDDINQGKFIRLHNTNYLHCGRGGYALVYHIQTPDGRDVALRCWTVKPPSDAAERCHALDGFLKTCVPSLPYFVKLQFYPDALLADGAYRPIFLMEWIFGETLQSSVYKLTSMGDSQAVSDLSDRTQTMIMRMQEAGVSHGDLQHDNIIVLPTGDLRLVDYDSAYVPTLQGYDCPVNGLQGYAHPVYLARTSLRPFNLTMDTFAGLVLITSLRAISLNLSFFQRFTKENLLFRAEDLQDPIGSPTFAALLSFGDGRLAALAGSLREMCLDPAKAQVLLAQVPGIGQERKKAPGPRLTEPVLPIKPAAWKPQPAMAQSIFAAIFHSKA